MKILIAILLFFSLSVSAIEISDFKSGLMCGINKDDMGWVCFEQEEINVTGQSHGAEYARRQRGQADRRPGEGYRAPCQGRGPHRRRTELGPHAPDPRRRPEPVWCAQRSDPGRTGCREL